MVTHTGCVIYRTVLIGMCPTHVCMHEYRPYINLSYITTRLSDTYVFLSQYRGVNTMVDILALIYEVRRWSLPHPSPYPETNSGMKQTSFKSKNLTALSWYNILQHSHFYCSLTALSVISIVSSWHLQSWHKKEKNMTWVTVLPLE